MASKIIWSAVACLAFPFVVFVIVGIFAWRKGSR